jgi:hypothetical protein
MQFTADYRHTHVEIDMLDCELPGDEKTRIQESLEPLGEDLLDFPASELYLKIVHHPRIERYHAQAKLKLPGKTIITGHYSPWLDEALSKCLAKVRRRAEHYKDEAKPEAVAEAERRVDLNNVTEVATTAEPNVGELGKAIQRQDYRLFRRILTPHESWLRSQVARWTLRYPQVEAMIGEEFENDDVVEEVLLMAFEQFADRPDEKTVSEWLGELVDPAVRELWGDPLEREAASYARTLGTPGQL